MKNLINIYNQLIEDTYKVFHGTTSEFDTFSYDVIGKNTLNLGWFGYGFYFTDNKSEALLYGPNLITANITLNNPIDFTNITDTSINGSGFIRHIYSLRGFQNITYNGKPIKDIIKLLDSIENEFDSNNLYYDQDDAMLRSVYYTHTDNVDYFIGQMTKMELNDVKHIKLRTIRTILYEKYDITSLPVRVMDLINPRTFTQMAIQNGYDGVISENPTIPSGHQYVVFDKANIKIISKKI